MSLFGGNPSVSHFSANIPFRLPLEDGGDSNKRRREQSTKLKELGFKTKYFQYRDNDPVGKAKAKKECTSFAKKWEKKSGVSLSVCEGCFL